MVIGVRDCVNNNWLKENEYFQTSVDVHRCLVDCKICLSRVCVSVCVCVLDTWSLNRVFRMSVSVYFSIQGSLQRSRMSPQLENKHINSNTHDHFLVSRFWLWSHGCVNYHDRACAAADTAYKLFKLLHRLPHAHTGCGHKYV